MAEHTLDQEALAEAVPCGIITLSMEGKITYANAYLYTLLGYSREDLQGEPVEKIFTLSTKIFYQTHFFPLLTLKGKAEEIFISLKANDGSSVPVLTNAQKAGDELQCVFLPVWQRKKYEEEILQAKRIAEQALEKNELLNKLKQQAELQLIETDRQLSQLKQFNNEYVQLSKIIAHDLHEPVRKLLIHIDILLSEENPNHDILNAHLQKMISFGNRLRLLTYSLQQYVDIDVATEELSKVDLNALVSECFEQAATLVGYTGAILQAQELPVVEGYYSLLKRLFGELFTNSLKFAHSGRPLQVKVSSTLFSNNIYKEKKDKYRYIDFVRIDIDDNGIGFPQEYNEYIFQLFTKIHLDKEGPGFGLALARKIVTRHNGKIYASPHECGITTSIQLPLTQKDF